MKSLIKLFIFSCLILLTTNLTAQSVVHKPVICDEKEKVIAGITNDQIRERPVWAGAGKEGNSSSVFVVFINEQSGSWTIAQFIENWGCIVAFGNQFSLSISELISKSLK